MTDNIAVVAEQQQALEQQGQGMAVDANALVVVDEVTFAKAAEMVKVAVAYIKRVGEVLDPIVDAAHKAHKTAVAQRDALLKPAQGVRRILGERMATWEQEQARKRREAEEAQRRERERLEREQRELAEREQARLRKEAEDRAVEAAAAAEARGDTTAAERILVQPVAMPTVTPAPVFVAQPPAPVPPRVEGVSFRDQWEFAIDNPALLPREYLMPDEKKISGVVRAMRGQTAIPGVRVFTKRIASVRT